MMDKGNNINDVNMQPDLLEIGLMAIATLIGKNRTVLVSALFIGGIIGVCTSFLYPKEYMSSTQLLPELKQSNSSTDLSSLASMAGIDVKSSVDRDAFRPDLYPNVLQSIPALVHLLRQPVETESKKYVTLLKYFEETQQISVPPGEVQSLSYSEIWHFNRQEDAIIKDLKDRITVNYDKKSGIILIQSEMPDPLVSATTLSYIIEYLTNYVVSYRKDKKREYTEFIESRLRDIEVRFKEAEFALNKYRDSNLNIINKVAQIKEQKLQADYMQLQAIYKELLNKREKAIINEKEGEAVIKVINPPAVPVDSSSPKILFYALGGSVVAIFLSIMLLLIPWKRKKTINNKDS